MPYEELLGSKLEKESRKNTPSTKPSSKNLEFLVLPRKINRTGNPCHFIRVRRHLLNAVTHPHAKKYDLRGTDQVFTRDARHSNFIPSHQEGGCDVYSTTAPDGGQIVVIQTDIPCVVTESADRNLLVSINITKSFYMRAITPPTVRGVQIGIVIVAQRGIRNKSWPTKHGAVSTLGS